MLEQVHDKAHALSDPHSCPTTAKRRFNRRVDRLVKEIHVRKSRRTCGLHERCLRWHNACGDKHWNEHHDSPLSPLLHCQLDYTSHICILPLPSPLLFTFPTTIVVLHDPVFCNSYDTGIAAISFQFALFWSVWAMLLPQRTFVALMVDVQPVRTSISARRIASWQMVPINLQKGTGRRDVATEK